MYVHRPGVRPGLRALLPRARQHARHDRDGGRRRDSPGWSFSEERSATSWSSQIGSIHCATVSASRAGRSHAPPSRRELAYIRLRLRLKRHHRAQAALRRRRRSRSAAGSARSQSPMNMRACSTTQELADPRRAEPRSGDEADDRPEPVLGGESDEEDVRLGRAEPAVEQRPALVQLDARRGSPARGRRADRGRSGSRPRR